MEIPQLPVRSVLNHEFGQEPCFVGGNSPQANYRRQIQTNNNKYKQVAGGHVEVYVRYP
jgi:hypothetical protein